MNKKSSLGFTLIEVLIALMIIAIGMTALLKTIAFDIQTTGRLKDNAIQHMIGMNAIAQIQTNNLPTSESQSITQVTTLLGQKWYWRAKLSRTPIKSMQQITVSVSPHQAGPFTHPLTAYRFAP